MTAVTSQISNTSVLGASTAPVDDLIAYRRSLGVFPTGITVMTAAGRQRRVGVTANSFCSLSLEPALVLWNLRTTAPSLPVFREAGHFAVNVLAWHQQEISMHFAKPSEDKFTGIPHTIGLGESPLLDGCAAHFQCELAH
jgi:flavin reductase (DIM6/NTAB) family NADH-FMN oxidoreductase RutF